MNTFDKIIKIIERFIIITLVVLMAIVLTIASVEVAITIITKSITNFTTNGVLIGVKDLLDIFSLFLTILIGFELFETVKLYMRDNIFHGEVILLVSLIAVSRKVILIEYTQEDPLTLFAIAALIISISTGYYIIKRKCKNERTKNIKSDEPTDSCCS